MKAGVVAGYGERKVSPLRALGVASLAACLQACSANSHAIPDDFDVGSLPEIQVTERTVLGGFGLGHPDALGIAPYIALLEGGEAMAVVAVDTARQRILRYSLDGEPLGENSEIGRGPGGFRAIRQVGGARGGGVYLWESLLPGVIALDADLEVKGEQQSEADTVGSAVRDFVGFLSDGGYILRDRVSRLALRDVAVGMWRDTVRLDHYSSTGEFLGTVALVEGEPEWWFRSTEGMGGSHRPVFGTELEALVVNDEVWLGSTREFVFTRYEVSGEVLGRVELRSSPRIASAEEVQAERERRIRDVFPDSTVASAGQGKEFLRSYSEYRREAIREVPSRDTLPAYDRVVSGVRGLVLLREYPRPQDTTARWVLIDSDGSPIGTLRLPRKAEVRAASPEVLIIVDGSWRESQVIRVLDLQLGAGGRS